MAGPFLICTLMTSKKKDEGDLTSGFFEKAKHLLWGPPERSILPCVFVLLRAFLLSSFTCVNLVAGFHLIYPLPFGGFLPYPSTKLK